MQRIPRTVVMDVTCGEKLAVITENNAMVTEIMEKQTLGGDQQQERLSKLNSFLSLLDRLQVLKVNKQSKLNVTEHLELDLAIMCNALWLCFISEDLQEMCDSVLLCRTDEGLKNILPYVLEALGELKTWPGYLNGRNTFVIAYMKLILEKIILLPIGIVRQVLKLCALSIFYVLQFDLGEDVMEDCIELLTVSSNISRKMSVMDVETCSVSSALKQTKINDSVNEEELHILQFELHQCTATPQSSFLFISEALTIIQILCCSKLKNKENAMAVLTLPVGNVTCFLYIFLYVKAFALICHREMDLSSMLLWNISQLTLGDSQKATFNILQGFYLMSNGFYASAHKQFTKAIESKWMLLALGLVCSNFRFLIRGNKGSVGNSTSKLLGCYIELLKMWRSAHEQGRTSVKLSVWFEYAILKNVHSELRYSDLSVSYEIARNYAKQENYVCASKEYLALLASLSGEETDSNASNRSENQFFLPKIRLITHETILVHMKSSQLDTALMLCEMSINQSPSHCTKISSAEDFILHMRDDIIAIMLSGEICIKMGKISQGKDLLVRCMEIIVNCLLDVNSSLGAKDAAYENTVRGLLSSLLASVYVQIAECCLQNYSVTEASNFLQRSWEINPGNQKAVLLYRRIHTKGVEGISQLLVQSQETIQQYSSLAMIYLLYGKYSQASYLQQKCL